MSGSDIRRRLKAVEKALGKKIGDKTLAVFWPDGAVRVDNETMSLEAYRLRHADSGRAAFSTIHTSSGLPYRRVVGSNCRALLRDCPLHPDAPSVTHTTHGLFPGCTAHYGAIFRGKESSK